MGVESGSAALTMGEAYLQSQAIMDQGKFQREQAEVNARFLDRQAGDAEARGQFNANRQEAKARKINASARVAAAASGGLNINVGAPAEGRLNNEVMAANDSMLIKSNAYREAFGYRVAASNSRLEGGMAFAGARYNSAMTLLGGGLKAAKQAASGAMSASMGVPSFGGGGGGSTATTTAGSSYRYTGNIA